MSAAAKISYKAAHGAVMEVLAVIGVMMLKPLLKLFESVSRPPAHPTMERADNSTGPEFEEIVACVMENRGYSVRNVQVSGDFGADLIASLAADSIAVQVKKRVKGMIGPRAVRDAIGGREFHDCSRAMVVTNRFFSSAAEQQAEKGDVELVDRDILNKWMNYHKEYTDD